VIHLINLLYLPVSPAITPLFSRAALGKGGKALLELYLNLGPDLIRA